MDRWSGHKNNICTATATLEVESRRGGNQSNQTHTHRLQHPPSRTARARVPLRGWALERDWALGGLMRVGHRQLHHHLHQRQLRCDGRKLQQNNGSKKKRESKKNKKKKGKPKKQGGMKRKVRIRTKVTGCEGQNDHGNRPTHSCTHTDRLGRSKTIIPQKRNKK